ncbi:hypothetical protein V2J09_012574 [Rumex salicifolius]
MEKYFPRKLLFFALLLLLFTTIPLFMKSSPPTFYPSSDGVDRSDPTAIKKLRKCDIFSGEWVPNPDGPYYTNETCWAIHEHQNCMKYGRPDSDYLKWKWKPNGCDLPIFNPHQFLEIMRGKSLAFVGDSVARNQMQSLICLLSRVEYPYDRSYTSDEYYKRWHYEKYNFTVAMYTSTFLVKATLDDPAGPMGTGLYGIHLDEVDPNWSTHIDPYDFLVISAGHWFLRPLIYYRNQRLVGCRFCQLPNITDLSLPYGYRAAFRTAFRAILDRGDKFRGTVYLRTFSPAHFEGGLWNKGGDCRRQKPFKSNEALLQGMDLDMYMAQIGEFRAAEREGRKKGIRFRVMDTTQASLMRPDGHPSMFGHRPEEKVALYNDCVHWCLPGPIDAWNDFLLEMVRTEGVAAKEGREKNAREKKMMLV